MFSEAEAVESCDGCFAHQRVRVPGERGGEVDCIPGLGAVAGLLCQGHQNAGAHFPVEIGKVVDERPHDPWVRQLAQRAGGRGARESVRVIQEGDERGEEDGIGVRRHGSSDSPGRLGSTRLKFGNLGQERACLLGAQTRQARRSHPLQEGIARLGLGGCQNARGQALGEDPGDFRPALLGEGLDVVAVRGLRVAVHVRHEFRLQGVPLVLGQPLQLPECERRLASHLGVRIVQERQQVTQRGSILDASERHRCGPADARVWMHEPALQLAAAEAAGALEEVDALPRGASGVRGRCGPLAGLASAPGRG